MRRRARAGFSLIELMIAITLVAAISAGLLTAMRNGLLTMQRTQQRLEDARRAMGLQDLVRRQIGAAMPVRGMCSRDQGSFQVPIFRGNSTALLMISSESTTEGARGAPRILFYRVQQNSDQTVRLEVLELPFTGANSTAPYCDPVPTVIRQPSANVKPIVIYERLASCRFRYRNVSFDTLLSRDPWGDVWMFPYLPFAVRIEMKPAPGADTRMPLTNITVPLHIVRSFEETYADE